MANRIMESSNYDEALSIMLEYIEPVDQYGNTFEETNTFDKDIGI